MVKRSSLQCLSQAGDSSHQLLVMEYRRNVSPFTRDSLPVRSVIGGEERQCSRPGPGSETRQWSLLDSLPNKISLCHQTCDMKPFHEQERAPDFGALSDSSRPFTIPPDNEFRPRDVERSRHHPGQRRPAKARPSAQISPLERRRAEPIRRATARSSRAGAPCRHRAANARAPEGAIASAAHARAPLAQKRVIVGISKSVPRKSPSQLASQ
jgi:hypothetical protein